jgi:peptidyl-prolyl cis-trans isomerase A (cyclophilin A)
MKHTLSTMLLTTLLVGCAFAQTKAVAPAKPAAPPASKTSLLNPAALNATAPATFDAKFTTTKGDVTIHVTRAWAPHGADRFYNLVRAGFFTDIAFFRVLSGFMAQFGISGDPAVAAAWRQANIPDDKVTQSNTRGRVTFATAGPNTRTTQLFINFGNNAGLDPQGFSPIGEVTEGMDVIDKLYSGYGEGAPSGAGPAQERLQGEGKAYLDRNFPKLDKIVSAKIVTAPAAAAK